MGLSAYKQIRFPACMGAYGNVTLVINRPSYASLTQPANDTLYLGEGGEYYPFIVSGDFSLSKKFTTTRGRRALDDLNVGIRDGLSYTGKVNSIPVSEDFTSIHQTFFDVWFNEDAPYKAFLLYHDNATGNEEVTHQGWIDPTYNPSSDAIVISPLSSNQIWIGTRNIKMTALAQAQLNITWNDVLKTIGSSDCQSGTPYNGYMMAPNGLNGQQNTRADLFSSSKGALMQAVTYKQLDWTVNPCMVKEDAPVFPLNPWQSISRTNDIAQALISQIGIGYVVGDTGTINTGSTLAHYKITSTFDVGPVHGHVGSFILTDAGAGYATGTNVATTATSGVGLAFSVDITKVGTQNLWGPSGLVFIKLSTLFNKIASAIGATAPTVVSALKFWKQTSSSTYFPIDTANPIAPPDIYISLNVYAKSHPYDGSYWDNPVGWSPDTPISTVLADLSNMLLCDFNIVNASDGTQALVLTPIGEPSGTVPDWELIGSPNQEDPSVGARVVQVKYKADDLTIQSPIGIQGDSTSIELPARIHRIGKTSGIDSLPDTECIVWDNSHLTTEQADNCFKISWFEQSTSQTHVMPDCWKSLCYLYWYHSGSSNPGVYPSNWNAFDGSNDWTDSFFAINAITRAKNSDGSSYTAPANLQAEVNGNDYFNLRMYTAVAFATLTLSKPTVQSFTFAGIADSSGSIQAVKAGLSKQWRFGHVADQNWVATEISQLLLAGETTIKFQQYPAANGFPALTDLSYGPVGGTGGTTSTTGAGVSGSTSGATDPKNVVYEFPVTTVTVSGASTNNLSVLTALTNQSQAVIVNNTHGADVIITGLVAPSQNCTVILYNPSAYNVKLAINSSSSSASNRINAHIFANVISTIFSGGAAMLVYDIDNTRWQVVNIFPVPAEVFDVTYFQVAQNTDGTPLITLNPSWLATLTGFVKTAPTGDQIIQSPSPINSVLSLEANAGDFIGAQIFRVKDVTGATQLFVSNTGTVISYEAFRAGDGTTHAYIRSDYLQVDIAPYLTGNNIVGLNVGTARNVTLTDSTGNVNTTYILCGMIGKNFNGRELNIKLDTAFSTNGNIVITSVEDLVETTPTNRISGRVNRQFDSIFFNYDSTILTGRWVQLIN